MSLPRAPEAFIVDAVRTPVTRRGGGLAGTHPADLGAHVIRAWLAAGLPEAVPGVTVDRHCGSSQQAVHFAAQAVPGVTADLVVAGGVQNLSMVPIAAAMSPPYTDPFRGSEGWRDRYGTAEISQFRSADLIAEKWGLSRPQMERYALARTGGRYGLVTMCEGGGKANVTIVERL